VRKTLEESAYGVLHRYTIKIMWLLPLRYLLYVNLHAQAQAAPATVKRLRNPAAEPSDCLIYQGLS